MASHVLPGHGRLHHGLLQWTSVLVRGLQPKAVEAEPARQLPAGVVPFPAPFAGRVVAGRVAQPAHQTARPGKLMAHPRRHDRIAPGHRQPRQRVGQFPAMPVRIIQGRLCAGSAGCAAQTAEHRIAGLPCGWTRRAPQGRVQPVKSNTAVRRGQPVPGRQQVRGCGDQGLLLIFEHLQRQPGIQLRVVDPPPLQLPVLVVLHQVVIRVLRKGQRVEPERVHRRQLQQPQLRTGRLQVRQVEADQVVAQHEVCAVGKLVQLGQRRRKGGAASRESQNFVQVRPHSGEGVDAAIPFAYLQVQGQAARQGAAGMARCSNDVPPSRFHGPRRHITPGGASSAYRPLPQ